MIDWYGTVVGSKPNFQFPGGAWLANDGANHRIALLTSSKCLSGEKLNPVNRL
jgi:hypothetical protein